MMIKTVPIHVNIFIFFIWIFPVTDFLNGFFLTSGYAIPIGILYRFCFFFFLICVIASGLFAKSKFTWLILFFIVGNFSIFLIQGIVLQNSLDWLAKDALVFVKYFLWALIPYYFAQHKKSFKQVNLNALFLWISFLFTIELIVPYFLGIGYKTYDHSDAGYKGFFFANNDTSLAFIVSITFTARALLAALQKTWNLRVLFLTVLLFGNLFSLLLLGTKTGILYGILVYVFSLFYLLFKATYETVLHKISIWLISLFSCSWIVLFGFRYMAELVQGTYERIIYFYYLYDGNLIRLLTSSRSHFLENGWQYFLSDPHMPLTLLFGQGFEYRLEHFERLGLIEMDFFDAFFGLGFLGVLLLFLLLGYFAFKAFQPGKRSIYSFVFVVIIVYSFFAGHVLFSALSSTFLGLVCGGIILQERK
ncbi:O-antigen ligase family protein [Listeria kieliensis]|nr:O-antigen ligase family protein [Listeria kieliensis]